LSNLAQHVRLLMRQNGITSVNELSKRSGITLSTLQALVNGTSNPRPSTLRVLADFFCVSPRGLISDLSGTDTGPVSFESTSEVLRFLIDDVCISERELSRLTGVSQKIINNILLGRTHTPTDASLIPIAEFFSVSLEQLRAEEKLDMYRRKGENNEHRLQNYHIPLIPWSRLLLLPESLADGSLDQVRTKFSEPELFATKVGNFRAMEPLVRPDDLLIVDYQASFSSGDLFLIQTIDREVVVGNYARKQQTEVIHFSAPKFESMPLLQGRYRKLGLVKEIRRDD
jgi:transcriptional regulator with XRE-family HTH domain